VRGVYEAVRELVGEFLDKTRPWGQWSQPIADLLVTLYAGSKLDVHDEAHRTIIEACDAIVDCLRKHQQADATLAPRLSGGDAITIILRGLRRASVPPPANPNAIELLGRLELVLDDAPALVVTGYNEEFIPTCRNGDLFLPNDLRRALSLEDNDCGFARDAYALAALVASKKRLHVIFGRRTADGDPLTPSRLLFAADDTTIAERALAWFSTPSAESRLVLPRALKAGRAKPDFIVPKPQKLPAPVEKMRVTEFRDYLACPYRYYLRHRLRLEAIDDAAEELDDAQFGSLVHDVLQQFAQGDLAASTFREEIDGELGSLLNGLARHRYGKAPLPTVLVQIEQARRRLNAFARWQAEWVRGGWRIRYVEEDMKKLPSPAELIVDGRTMILTGRIDRIDYNEQTGEWAVLDYKTGDGGREPEKTHRKDGAWIDLQLPLYRHLVARLNLGPRLKLGYIVLPKTLSGVKVAYGNWTDEDLASADEQAREVVRGVWAERFWPPADPPPAFSEDFAAICHDGIFGAAIASEEEEEAT
jgi:hypothetical protein